MGERFFVPGTTKTPCISEGVWSRRRRKERTLHLVCVYLCHESIRPALQIGLSQRLSIYHLSLHHGFGYFRSVLFVGRFIGCLQHLLNDCRLVILVHTIGFCHQPQPLFASQFCCFGWLYRYWVMNNLCLLWEIG
jgi:hypothetical protein